MKTRTRTRTETISDADLFEGEDIVDLDSLSDEELEEFLFHEEERPKGIFNLPTIAGLSLIMVGAAYILQQLGLFGGFDLTTLAAMLPWLGAILIILLGFGVLSWRPRSKPKQVRKKKVETKSGTKKVVLEGVKSASDTKKRLEKSRDKKIAGVCAGIAEYFNIDPTLVRIAFVIATIASSGSFFVAYIVLAMVMPNPKGKASEERITIVRDS